MTVTLAYPDGQTATQDIDAASTDAANHDPYALGGLAWFRGLLERDCPYPIPSRRAERWLAGWRESQATFDRTPVTESEIELGEAGA